MKYAEEKIKAPLGLDYVFRFGKYKEEQITIREVCDNKEDSDYVFWCMDNIDWFDVTPEVEEFALECRRPLTSDQCYPDSFDDGKWTRY